MLSTKQKGNITELQCMLAFYQLGYAVSVPYGDCERYDFIVDIEGRLIRVQAKTCHSTNENRAIEFSCKSVSKSNNSRKYSSTEIDYFSTFFNGECYLIPVNECSTTKKLHFSAPNNNQKVGISYAKDYILSSQVDRIKE